MPAVTATQLLDVTTTLSISFSLYYNHTCHHIPGPILMEIIILPYVYSPYLATHHMGL